MIINSYISFGAVAFDADAQIFIDAGVGFTSTQQNALNQLFLDFKTGQVNASNIFPKCVEYWPQAGTATLANHTLGMKRAFDGTMVNTPSGSDTGLLLNGSSQYMRTGIIPSTDTALNDVTLVTYLKNNTEAASVSIGAADSAIKRLFLINRIATNRMLFDAYTSNSSIGRLEVTNTDSSALNTATRRASNDAEGYRNAGSLGNSVQGGGTRPTRELYLGANNNVGSPSNYVGNEMRGAGVFSGLTDNEVADLFDAVQRFNTSLSRQV